MLSQPPELLKSSDCPIGQGGFWLRMHFDHQPVGTHCQGCPTAVDQVPARPVTGINDTGRLLKVSPTPPH